VIEDEPVVAEMMRAALERQGYVVHWQAEGRVGLQAAAAIAPRVIVLDLLLPDCDGVDVLRAIDLSPALAHIPVIVCSAATWKLAPEDRLLAWSAIRKPFRVGLLLDAVQRAAAGLPPPEQL